jgi:hypothetical protein
MISSRYWLVLVCLGASACGPWAGYKPGPGDAGYGTGPTGIGSSSSSSATTADYDFCLSETNRYRAMANLAPLVISATLQTFADAGATADNASQTPHGHFLSANGADLGYAENEIPWVPYPSSGTVQQIIAQGLAAMWAEGAQGADFVNLVGPFIQMGCGITIGNGTITIVQDFH